MPEDNKLEPQHHELPQQRKRLTIGFLVGTKELAVIQPERPQDTLTLLSGGRKMDFTGRDVLKSDKVRGRNDNRIL